MLFLGHRKIEILLIYMAFAFYWQCEDHLRNEETKVYFRAPDCCN